MITLKTLPQATALEVFNQVEEHLLSQGVKSIEKDNDACKYRHNDLSCAAGCLISDEEYYPAIEGNPWDDLVKNGIVPREHCDLIEELQWIHDESEVEEWPQELAKLKKKMGLDLN
jgi:hypothetical protein